MPARQASVAMILLVSACATPCAGPPPGAEPPGISSSAEEPAHRIGPTREVRPGVEVLLSDSIHLVQDARVGFLTNHSAVDREGRSAIDALHDDPRVNLVALFGPEHGLRGGIEGGVRIADERDAATGLPVFSLYGERRRPTAESLQGIDVLLFDMQDVGARPYTFVWTMAMAMEEAARHGVRFIVLDRPNPIGDTIEGPLMQPEMREVAQAITGYHPVPLRHGMTVGEIALYANREFDVGADLVVVPAEGWHGGIWFDETGLPWVDPSPNIRSLEAALTYAGLVLLEATNLSVGRGTEEPFTYVGAPWIDEARFAARLREARLPGVEFRPVRFVPEGEGWVPYRGESVGGVHITVTDRDAYRSVETALIILDSARRLHPEHFEILNRGFDQMIGSHWAREAFEAGEPVNVLLERWAAEIEAWRPVRERYRLYRP